MSDRDTEHTPPPAPEDGGFLSRWSRRKQAVAAGQPLPEPPAPAAAAAVPPAEPEPPLPDPETLDFADDFSAYLKARVPPALKKAAMRKLFSDPSFNRMDGLDVYVEDFNQVPDLPAAEAALLAHAKDVLAPTRSRTLADLVAERDREPVHATEAAQADAGAAAAPAPGATAERADAHEAAPMQDNAPGEGRVS